MLSMSLCLFHGLVPRPKRGLLRIAYGDVRLKLDNRAGRQHGVFFNAFRCHKAQGQGSLRAVLHQGLWRRYHYRLGSAAPCAYEAH